MTDCLDDNDALAYVERTLPEGERRRIAAHLDRCESCLAVTCAIARTETPGGQPPDSKPGAIGRYALIEMIGRGGMGSVYIARDPQLDRNVALKVVRSERYAEPQVRARLSREARAMARVKHPNVVTVYDAGELADGVFIAMELIEGETLGQWLAASERTWREIVEMFIAVGGGLVAAHTAGIVHRDFKPANVLVDREGRPAVTDFGIAMAPAIAPDPSAPPVELADADPHALTQTGVLAGTPNFMSPEQFRTGAVDARSDQYSYGVALFEALFHIHPFGGATTAELRDAAVRGELRTPADERGVPSAVKQVVTRALKNVPDQRYPDMRALLAELRAAIRPAGRRRAVAAAIAVSLAAITAGSLAYSRHGRQPPALDAGLHGPATGRKPATPAAAAAFDAAVQAERDGNLPEEKRSLKAAIAADPAFGTAYLRLVLYVATVSDLSDEPRDEADALATYHQALDHRATLGDVDAAILDAWQPRFRAPPDRAERSRRLAVLAKKFPTEIRVQTLFAESLLHSAQLAEAETQIEHALVLDPTYVPALATNIEILNRLGQDARARALADRCIAASASAVSCLEARLTMSYDSGQCADLMADAKRLIAIDPASQTGYTALADGMASLGEPIDSIAETLKRADLLVDDADARHISELFSSELVDVLRGDLGGADRAAGDAVTFATAHPGQNAITPALRQLSLVAEEGDKNRARTLARRVRALIDASGVGEPDIGTEALVATLMQRVGGMTRDELHARQAQLAELQHADDERRGGKTDAFRLWGWIYGNNIANASEAADAAAALALAGGPDPKFANVPYFSQGLGTMYAFSGHGAEAIPYLVRAEASCYQLWEALDLTHDQLALGVAKQTTGDVAGARAAYQAVLHRWGTATPRSVTADEARVRLATLPKSH